MIRGTSQLKLAYLTGAGSLSVPWKSVIAVLLTVYLCPLLHYTTFVCLQ